ncbi:artemin [Bombina bombina]|uniref:artemin n=1 Tax=Bombina bombina TaxID=8345 RepID=UPI00235A6F92|nr:artemin [Bombina bombina]
MPWGVSEKQQTACKGRQASKTLSVLCAQRLQWSFQAISEEFQTGVVEKLWSWTDYGVVELDLNWAHPLEMLSFGQGDLTATLCHWWRRQTQTCRGLYWNVAEQVQEHWEGPLKASEVQFPEWTIRPEEEIAEIRVGHTGIYSEEWSPVQITAGLESSEEWSGSQSTTHDRSKTFMGSGSLSVKTPSRSLKVTLWTLLVSLLLLSAMVTGSPTMDGHQNSERESDSFGNIVPESLELSTEDNTDLPVRPTWSPQYGNITSDAQIEDELPSDLLFRAERSPETAIKSKKNKKKSSNRGSNKDCRLRTLMVKARDLGLGHNSDEMILFKYCSGVCKQSESNYDITLSALLKKKAISSGSQERVTSHPCCRPTKYENISFMDIQNEWKVVNKFRATECGCVG